MIDHKGKRLLATTPKLSIGESICYSEELGFVKRKNFRILLAPAALMNNNIKYKWNF